MSSVRVWRAGRGGGRATTAVVAVVTLTVVGSAASSPAAGADLAGARGEAPAVSAADVDRWLASIARRPGVHPVVLDVPGTASATMVTDSGVVVGRTAVDGRWRAFRVVDGVVALLEDGGNDAEPIDVNERGQVVGHVSRPEGGVQATLWDVDGTAVPMAPVRHDLIVHDVDDHGRVGVNRYSGQLGRSDPAIWHLGTLRELFGYGGTGWIGELKPLNNRGDVVGLTESAGFVWRDGVTTVPRTPSGAPVRPFAVTESGMVVGEAPDASGRGRVVTWDQGRTHVLDLDPPNTHVDVVDVNEHGTVLVTPARWGEPSVPVVAGRQGTVPLRSLGGPSSVGYALNDVGLVVGGSELSSSSGMRPVVWVLGVPVPLGARAPGSGVSSGVALDVNDRGQVVGQLGGRAVRWDLVPRR